MVTAVGGQFGGELVDFGCLPLSVRYTVLCENPDAVSRLQSTAGQCVSVGWTIAVFLC